MSVHWGVWAFDETMAFEELRRALPESLAQWGPDSNDSWSDGHGPTIGLRSFHVTHEDFRQSQPYQTDEGNIVAFDGRLDNRAELIRDLGLSDTKQRRIRCGAWNPGMISTAPFPVLVATPKASSDALVQPARWLIPSTGVPTDLELVAAAFDRWHVECFRKLQGDWTVVFWEAAQKRMWLAKDPFGARHLHYVHTDKVFCWSTRYECLNRMIEVGYLPSMTLTVDAQYRAASAVAMPPIDATPYNEVRSVPPAHAIAIRQSSPTEMHRYSMPPKPRLSKSISFEAATVLFKASLERSLLRRTRSAFPITFELSGGCDSSSLVCLAHALHRRGKLAQDFYTLTCYTPSKSNSLDRVYAQCVERFIGRNGRHIPVREIADTEEQRMPTRAELEAFDQTATSRLEHSDSLAARELWARRARYMDVLEERGSRMLLCGTGGDELVGGIQMAAESLMDEWASQPLPEFFQSIQRWARYKNETVWRLGWQIAMESIPLVVGSFLDGSSRRQAEAAHKHFPGVSKARLRMMKFAFSGTVRPWRSHRRQDADWWPLSVVLSHKQRLCHMGSWHRAFPYIDADWIRIARMLPSSYIQTAFQRRRLIRAALQGTVPYSVLWRRTKDFGTWVARSTDGNASRKLKDLEENAALLQVLRIASNFASNEPAERMTGPDKEIISQPSTSSESTTMQNTVYQVASHIRFVSDESGATLLDFVRGKRVVLNPTGAEIWRRLADSKTSVEIALDLASLYGIAREEALVDTTELVADFVQNGMLTPISQRPAERSEYVRT